MLQAHNEQEGPPIMWRIDLIFLSLLLRIPQLL
jgi:hypothetical protein